MEIKREKQERSTKLVLYIDDEPVSHLWVIDYEMRIGFSILRMGGIAGVWTEEKHRLKGYASKVLNNSIEFMKEEGYDVSLLFGIPNFYHRFGYATVLPFYSAQLEVSDIPSFDSRFTIEQYKPSYKDFLLSVYNQHNRTRTGTLVRTPEKWETFTHGSGWSSKAVAYVLLSEYQPVAYFVTDEVEPFIIEVGYKEAQYDIFASLLHHFKSIAEQRGASTLRISAPPDDPFMEFCQRYGLRLTIDYPLNRDGMGRIINLSTLFTKLKDTLISRLQGKFKGNLVLQTDIGNISLSINETSLEIQQTASKPTWDFKIPQSKLMQLIMGYRSIDDILLDDDVSISDEDARPLLRALFPKGFPHLWIPDRF
ncbi:GNAT family N-acetyltransferase [bacterium]|nr:GNAT family N-acetyltransferase [bacterium]